MQDGNTRNDVDDWLLEFHAARDAMKRQIARTFSRLWRQSIQGDPVDAARNAACLTTAIQTFTQTLKELFPQDNRDNVDTRTTDTP